MSGDLLGEIQGMRIKSIVGVISTALMITLFASRVDAGETTTKILKYDSQGNVIGYEETDVKGKKKSTSKKKSSGSSKIFNPDNAFEEGEVIVINPPRGFASGIRSMGYQVIETVKISALNVTVQRLRIPAQMSVPKAVRELRSRFPGVEIDANHQFDPSAGVEFPDKIARALIRWSEAPANCGKGVKIGMIDAGVDISHPAFKGNNVVYKSFHKEGREEGPKDHGTAVAAIMVGTPEWGGLLPGASLYAANMFEYNEEGRKVGNAIGLLKAANWLINERVHIINLSVAGADNKVLRRIFQKALQQNLVMVAAGGNWGRDDKPAFPAAYKGVVAVTAISDQGLIYSKANTGEYIDFAAPGVSVYTAALGGGGRLQSGTSFATPFITALMGLEIAKGNAKTPEALGALLKKNVKDLGLPG
ncbi:MAG: S8 family serine peptidase, partial [Rhodospirillaceae bacterium]|nr:S8 family serine peptidase [Rhodospirillaceae bacterium]